ncbi:MAG: UDP-N-acetylmuramoyl-tripeptide--D-alanyl-D-alanine ligase [Peptococcaceae bacterium]|nr:MAG: UDP-N-acetylmuramoyl-tripeptide--D-alanyl-D-alanine ligase [Peptococcaceae bacterium]
MRRMSVGEIAGVTGGELVRGDPSIEVSAVSTDTRQLRPGELFFALTGDRYDAHVFLTKAFEAGAAGAVVSRLVEMAPAFPVIRVADTLTALQTLAAYNRSLYDVPVIGITGSTGKTTTKDMVASVLGARLRVLKTEGNLNNEIGLPLTLLAMDGTHQAAVVEMAMRGPGEIDRLCQIARPTGAVITSIGESHLERLGTISNIAKAKGEILDHIPPEGFALLNGESPFILREAGRCRGRVIFFTLVQSFDRMLTDKDPEFVSRIVAAGIEAGNSGSWFTVRVNGETDTFYLPAPGRHNVQNALAAVGVGRELGLSPAEIADGLAKVALTGMRLEVVEAGDLKIINDAYNASPASDRAALQVLTGYAAGGRKVAVLGDMLELGPRAKAGHREVGETAAALGVDCLVTVGELAREIAAGAVQAGLPEWKVFSCAGNDEVIRVLQKFLKPGDVVLVKGSRGMKMEQVVRGLGWKG